MRASEFESIDHVPPVDWKDAPQEVRDALNALKEGRDAPDVFFLKSDLTQTQKERRVTIAWACTIFVAVFGLGVCAPLALKQSVQGGLIVVGTFSFVTFLSWFFWVCEVRAVAADPWYESMVCTPHYLMVNMMGMTRILELDEWQGVVMQTRMGKYMTFLIFLTNGKGRFCAGTVNNATKESVEAFANKLHQRIQQRSMKEHKHSGTN